MYRWVDNTSCVNCPVLATLSLPAQDVFIVSIINIIQLMAFRKSTADIFQNKRKLINLFIGLNKFLNADAYNYI
jgi:hypothetical protein